MTPLGEVDKSVLAWSIGFLLFGLVSLAIRLWLMLKRFVRGRARDHTLESIWPRGFSIRLISRNLDLKGRGHVHAVGLLISLVWRRR